MTEREKVISKLQILRTWCAVNPNYGKGLEPEDCTNMVSVLDDALALLKEQETRVMTEGEVLHSTGKPIWFESRGMYLSKRGFWILPFEVDSELHIRFVQSVTGGKIIFSLSDYGKVWRAWTSRPSEQQMQDTKWEGEKE